MSCPQSILPAGFRFHPTDEELILHYLMKKAASLPLPVSIVAEVDIYKFDPWELPAQAMFGEKEWYFFSQRDRKYPNGARPNRAAASGYWKATGTDKVITASATSENIGVKKALVFYKGKPPKGIKTAWIMHEYRLPEAPNYGSFNHKPLKFRESSSSMRLDDWVLCRVYKKSNLSSPHVSPPMDTENDFDQPEHYTQGPTISIYNNNSILQPHKCSSFSNLLDTTDYTMLNNFLFDNHQDATLSTSTVNYSSEHLDQPILGNYTGVDANDYNTSIHFMENRLNYQRSNHDIDVSPQAERFIGTWASGSSTCQFDDNSHYKLFDEGLLEQHVHLSPKFQFQG